MKSLDFLFKEYSADHQNLQNQRIHMVCVPLILLSVIGASFSLGEVSLGGASLSIAWLLLGIYTLRNLLWSFPIGLAVSFFSLACGAFFEWMSLPAKENLILSAALFLLGWAGQFYGHKIEKKKPSFLKDLSYLLVGPMWVAGKLMGRGQENN